MKSLLRTASIIAGVSLAACGSDSEKRSDVSARSAFDHTDQSAATDQTYQYVGVINTLMTENHLRPRGYFFHLSENITKQNLLEHFETYLDTCVIAPLFAKEVYQAEFGPNTYSSLLNGTVRKLTPDNPFYNAIATRVSVGDITLSHLDSGFNNVIRPQPDLSYERPAIPVSLLGETISIDIAGENFPAFSNMVNPVSSQYRPENMILVGENNTYTWESEVKNDVLSYVDLSIEKHNVIIHCRLTNDGHFEMPASVLDELQAVSPAAFDDYMSGQFDSFIDVRQMAWHSSDNALVVLNSIHAYGY